MKKIRTSILSILLVAVFLLQPFVSLADGTSGTEPTDAGAVSDEEVSDELEDEGEPVPEPNNDGDYTVVFVDWNGVTLSVQRIKHGEAAIAPDVAPRTDYKFVGWNLDFSEVTQDLYITAEYEPLTSWTITINYLNNEDQTMVHGPYVDTVIDGESYNKTITSPIISGYTANELEVTINKESVIEDITINVLYTPATGTKYKVEHYQQNLSGGGYTIKDTDNLTGSTGQLVTASPKAYTGFTPPAQLPSGIIAADGSTTLKVYYKRNLTTLYFESAGGSYVAPISKLYGSSVTPPTPPTRAGYVFDKWDKAIPTTMPAEDQTFTASWKVSGSVNYTVVYWLETPDSKGYDFVGSEQKKGAAGSTIATPATPPSTINFPIATTAFALNAQKTNDEKPTSISGDGTTIFNIYYTRRSYTLTFRFDSVNYNLTVNGVTYTQSPYTFTAKLGQDISDLWPYVAPTRKPSGVDRGNFTGWSGGGSSYSTRQITLQSNHISAATFQDTWSTSTREVTIRYWFANLGGNGYTERYTQVLNISNSTTRFNSKDFPGFTAQSTSMPITDNINFQYTRNTYSLIFYNGVGIEKTVPLLPYETSISNQYYEPARPANIGDDYKFAGWYTTPEGHDNSKFNFTGAIMPASNIILYSRWDKPTYTVTFNADNGETNPPDQIINLQGKATQPSEPTKAGYIFNGWYLQGEALRYVFDYPVVHDLNLTANWIPSDNLSYTVEYIVPGRDTIIETFSGKKTDDVVTAKAKYIEGFLPDKVSKSLTISPGENIIRFNYTAISQEVEYTIQYLYKDSGKPAIDPVTYQTDQNQVVVNYTAIPGYYPDFYQKTLQISGNKDENVVTFYYSKNPDVSYTIKHYLEELNGSYTLKETDADLKAAAGALLRPEPKSYDHYTFNPDASTPERVIASNGSTVFHFYYDRVRLNVNFTSEGNGALTGETQFKNIRYGAPYNSVVTTPTAVPDTGYKFSWSEEPPTDNRDITQNATYTATFVKDNTMWATIKYDKNNDNATGTMTDSESLLIGSSYTLANNTFEYTNHTFVGWNTMEDRSGADYGNADTITVPSSITLYAQWNENNKYSVIYHANGGTDTTADEKTYYEGNTATILSSGFTYAGYTFTHWNTSADGKGTKYEPDAVATITDNLHLYAIWEVDETKWSTITFEKGNYPATGTMEKLKVLKNVEITLPENQFILNHYNFTGWKNNLDNKVYQPNGKYTPTESEITFTAQWEEHERYAINFYSNYPGNNDPDSTVKYSIVGFYLGDEFTVASTDLFTYHNYKFIGWNTKADDSGEKYAPSSSAVVPGNLNLYAIWKENPTFKVTYKDTIAETYVEDITVYHINDGVSDDVITKGVIFAHKGYELDAWDMYQDDMLAVQGIELGSTLSGIIKDIELRSVWNVINYNLSYNLDGGVLINPNPTSYTVESETFTLNNPTKAGYTFEGWKEGSNAPVLTVTIPKGSVGGNAYQAIWKKDDKQWSTITFVNSNDEQGSLSGVRSYEGVIGQSFQEDDSPTTTPLKGYEFEKWSPEIPETFPRENIAITAYWKEDYSQWKTITYETRDDKKGTLNGTTVFRGIEGTSTDNITTPEPMAQPGYKFTGWSIDLPTEYTANITIYAEWVKVDDDWFTITFDPGNTTMGNISGTLSYNGAKSTSTSGIKPPKPIPNEGYLFNGWSREVPYSYEENIVITANWKKDAKQWSTIKFESADVKMGSLIDDLTFQGIKGKSTLDIVDYPDTVAIPGYKFVGWSRDIPETYPDEDVTIQAYWEYDATQWSTIQFCICDPVKGYLFGTSTYKGIKGTPVTIDPPTAKLNKGYRFEGWAYNGKRLEEMPDKYPEEDMNIVSIIPKVAEDWSTITFKNSDPNKGTLEGTLEFSGVKGTTTESIILPKVTPKIGYKFDGWSITLPEEYPNSDIVITAKWKAISSGGGKDGNGSDTPDKPTITPKPPVKPTQPPQEGPQKPVGTKPPVAPVNIPKDTTVKAPEDSGKDDTKVPTPDTPQNKPEEPTTPQVPLEELEYAPEGWFVPLNLIITILSVILFIVSMFSQIRPKSFGVEENKKLAHTLLTLSEVFSIAVIILYIFTATFGPKILLFDRWTIWLASGFILQSILFGRIFSKKFDKEENPNQQ